MISTEKEYTVTHIDAVPDLTFFVDDGIYLIGLGVFRECRIHMWRYCDVCEIYCIAVMKEQIDRFD
ncbi:MAG: hypothetical protein ACLUGO_08125 [Mediterraneibacter faecis]